MKNDSTGVNNRITILLFMMLFLSIVNAIPVVIAVMPELAIAKKEVRNNWYSPNAFIPAKLIIETPLLTIPPLLFLSIAGGMSHIIDSDDGSNGRHGIRSQSTPRRPYLRAAARNLRIAALNFAQPPGTSV